MPDTGYSIQNEFSFDATDNQYTYVEALKKKGEAFETVKDSVLIATNQEMTYEVRF